MQARRQEMKWGCFFVKKSKKWGVFCKKVENGGCFVKSGKYGVFFCKKWTFRQRRVHYVQYQYFFILHFTYLGLRTHPTHAPAQGPVMSAFERTDSC